MAKIKSFFIKVGQWFKRHAPTKRRLIQIYTALLFNANLKGIISGGDNIIYTGGVKNICSPGLNCYSCPGAVASCPLGALQNAMGNTDTRAPYYVLGIIGLLGLMFARTICGFFCPVGLGQELLYKIKTPKLKKSRYTRILSYFKYVLLIVMVIAIPAIYADIPAFCKYICPAGTSASILQLINPFNDDKYGMLGFLFSWKFSLLVAFIVGSIFIFRFFCRFFCPLGAIYGFFNKIALIGVKLDRQKCIDCGMCIQTCQMDIKHVGDHECINCGACISVCPTKAISWKGDKLFIKKSEIEEEVKAPSLTAVLESGTTLKTAEEVSGSKVAIESVKAEAETNVSVKEDMPVQKSAAVKAFNKRAFWLQFSAWALALCVLVASLVYFNFFAPTSPVSGIQVGDDCPDFTFSTVYDSKGAGNGDDKITEISVSEITGQGKVLVLNYWYTTCGPCVAELPGFNRVREEFGDDVMIVALHKAGLVTNAKIQEFIDTTINDGVNYWSEYSLVFGLDTNNESYRALGGSTIYPMTVIVGTDGKISFRQHGPVEEDDLRQALIDAGATLAQ
ncbi:MAG: 4Fe-4S binding protein [Clostridia bacterium]|nr:4Fe-4S binding protein [Clostridia bacterium]